jgi:oxygen-independent coproporphyrinogen-3 oxidase
MAGLYFHIPFCRKACTYCDFHFSTSHQHALVLDAMEKELVRRSRELGDASVGTIYFGGGTPSLLPAERIADFVQLAHDLLRVERDVEVTLEANPDDVTEERLAAWRAGGVTRISLGTQSFRNDRLRWMGRAHDAAQALTSIELIAHSGFRSWTIDLIYGLPGMDLDEWDEQLSIALDHGMPHLSAYCLTVEPRTALEHQVRNRVVLLPGDDAQSTQFTRLIERMEEAGFEQYEISNFARDGHRSRHNSSYWAGVPYVGIGPSAHSYNGTTRRWNIANNARYVKAVGEGTSYWTEESLTPTDRVNEALMTGLRTVEGVDLAMLGEDFLELHRSYIDALVSKGHGQLTGTRLALTKAGRHFADRIASDLFLDPHDSRDRT